MGYYTRRKKTEIAPYAFLREVKEELIELGSVRGVDVFGTRSQQLKRRKKLFGF